MEEIKVIPMKIAKKGFLWVCVLLFALSVQSPVGWAQETQQMVLDYHFSTPLCTAKDGQTQVSIEGLNNVCFSNAELPVKHVPVLLPYGKTVDHYSVTYTTAKTVENVELPTPPRYYTTSDDSLSMPAGDKPADSHASEGTVMYQRGFALFVIDLYPVTYVGKTLSAVQDMQLSVSLKDAPAETKAYVPTVVDTSFLPDVYDCPENLSTYYRQTPTQSTAGSALLGTARYDYVIITPQGFINSFAPLITYKKSKGVRAVAVSLESVYNHYSGRDYAYKIRAFLHDAYLNNRIRFVLLGGDADANSRNPKSIVDYSIVPTRQLYCKLSWFSTPNNYIASDLYYACLDGDYDHNKNNIYGEPTDGNYGRDVDLLADVYVGRAPVNSITEVKNFVNKTIAYEKRSKKKFALTVGEKLDSDTYGMSYMEQIRKGSTANGITTKGFPSGYNVSVLYDKTYANHNWPVSALITQLNRSPEIVFHLGHCNNTYLMRMIPYNLNSLTNQYSFFLYSQGCYPGAFDNMDADNYYYDVDSIGEQLVVSNAKRGAVACALNSRYGWYAGGSTDGASQAFNRFMIHEYNKAPRTSLGALLAKSKADVLAKGYLSSDSVYRYCYYEFNLLGDPEMSLTTSVATLDSQYTLADEEKYLQPLATDAASAPKTGDTFPLTAVALCLIFSMAGTAVLLTKLRLKRKHSL